MYNRINENYDDIKGLNNMDSLRITAVEANEDENYNTTETNEQNEGMVTMKQHRK